MKQVFLVLFLCSNYIFLSAMDRQMVIFPSEKVLLERLQPIKEYEHFIQNSAFIKTFAEKEKYSPEVFMVLGFKIEEYYERFKDDKRTFYLEMLKPKVITLMLQDYPDAIIFLKKEGVLAELVLLPSAPILSDYCKLSTFDGIACKTSMVQDLADKQIYPTEIFMIIDSQLDEYVKRISNVAMAKAIKLLVPIFTKTILQKHPKAISFLIDEGLIK